ncbi:methyl-accepting chemotaxis protein [Paenibacillus hemerocallicola]|uniref:Methyl-accepting chemotaxis protein n=1 Tax=Paenibacillus hemerocallicola TaxID=1172614 RepID=A0A5C4T1Y4_9BACL|nr:methyl-accepting chemotaxis protein [Paenibacillus hemerocallicola]TNJ62770.1 methyl-accepting chemotaxis protein [Paenibacillus hemerocallicola]
MKRKRFVKEGRRGMNSVTMKAKLIASFAVIVAMFSGTASFHLHMQNEIGRQVTIQNAETEKSRMAMRLKQEVQELAVIHAGLVVTKQAGAEEQYAAVKKLFIEDVKRIGDTASSSDERKWKAKLDNVSGEFTATFDAALETLKAKTAAGDDLSRQLEQQYALSQTHKEFIFELVEQFNVKYTEGAEHAVAESDRLFAEAKTVAAGTMAAALILAVAIAIMLIRSFLTPIKRMQRAMGLIGEGDLSHRIDSPARDELGLLGASFDHMMDNVSGMLVRLRGVGTDLNGRSAVFRGFSQTTAAANADILKAIGEIAAGADLQAAFTEKSAHLVAGLGREVSDIARSADEMKRFSETADAQAKNGADTVAELSQAAERADDMLQRAESAVDLFVQDAVNISKIVHTISEIANQTNVLSLNASIEAARAGQHGKGFLVIAHEVRQLSDQSKSSAKLIADMIGSLQKQITEVRGHMEAASEAARMQGTKVQDTLSAFRTIQSSIADLHGQTDLIHMKVKRAEAGNESLIDTIQHVAAIAEETAAGVQEVNSTSIEQNESVRQIAEQADAMHALAESLFLEIGKFKTPDDANYLEAIADAYPESEIAIEQQPSLDSPEELAREGIEPDKLPQPYQDEDNGNPEAGEAKKEERKQLVTV